MKNRYGAIAAAFALPLISGCMTGDKPATPADTTTGQSTSVAPSGVSAPVVAPVAIDSAPVSRVPKAATPRTVPTERDSAFKPRATVDDKGNIQPIRRDTLK